MSEPRGVTMNLSSEDDDAAAAAAAAGVTTRPTDVLSSIKTLKCQLANFIDPDFGLLDHLLILKVVTPREAADVRSERTVYRRNDALLDLLTAEDKCNVFLQALQRTGQQHVVNYIAQNGDIGAEYGDIRPLDGARIRKLAVNGIQLLDRMDPNLEFVTELATAGSITWLQREHIIEIVHRRDRNDKLLEFITRRSVFDFNNFIKVLSKEQEHLVPFLVTDGVVVDVDADLVESSVDDMNQTEDRIVSHWREISADEQHQLRDSVDEILRPLGFRTRLLVVERDNSLALYFFCMTLAALMSLRDLWRRQRLRDTLQSLFTILSRATRTVRVNRLSWPLNDYQRCLEFFKSVEEEQDSSKAVRLSAVTSELSASKLQSSGLSDLPLEMLETVLMRAFLMLYSSDHEGDHDIDPCVATGKSRSSERRAFTVLASVCSDWYRTVTGWPLSSTPHWVRHQLRKLIERSCRPFQRSSPTNYVYKLDVEYVYGVTQLHDVVYIVCRQSSTILRFSATTHQRLTDIDVKDLRTPWDMVACERTSRVYVAERTCIWRVSSDGVNITRWLPKSPSDTFKPWTLSVTSTRLLVTSFRSRQLMQFDADGDELRCVQLPDDMKPWHAVESPAGTFIVSRYNTPLDQYQVAEVNTGGEVLRQFSGSRLPSLGLTPRVAVDSHGNIFVADHDNRCILLLDSRLTLRRTVIDKHQLNYTRPSRLCYIEQSGQLLVGLLQGGVAVFDMLCR